MGYSEIFIGLGLGLNIATLVGVFFFSKAKEIVSAESKQGFNLNKSAILFTGLLLIGFSFQVIGALYRVV